MKGVFTSLLMRAKLECERVSLKLKKKKNKKTNKQTKKKPIASSPITSWQIEEENVEVMTDFSLPGL